jgi:hypothetical protein
MAFDLLGGGPDLTAYGGLLDPETLAAVQKAARQKQQQAFGLSLLQAAGPHQFKQNFAGGIGNALAAANAAGDSVIGNQIPMALQVQQYRQKQAEAQAAKDRQAQVGELLKAGDWAGAAALDPQATNAYRQATAKADAAKYGDNYRDVEGPDGIYRIAPDGTVKQLHAYPDQRPKPPQGFEWGADGELKQIKGGPADPGSSVDARKAALGLTNFESSLGAYEKFMTQPGIVDKIRIPGSAEREQAGNLYTDLQLQAKEAAQLGALAGPDITILENLLADPTSVKAMAGLRNIGANLKSARDVLGRRKASHEKIYGKLPAMTADDPLGLR